MIQTASIRVEAAPNKAQSTPVSLDPLIRLFYTQKLAELESDAVSILSTKFVDAALIGDNTQLTLVVTVNIISGNLYTDFLQYLTKREETTSFLIISTTIL